MIAGRLRAGWWSVGASSNSELFDIHAVGVDAGNATPAFYAVIKPGMADRAGQPVLSGRLDTRPALAAASTHHRTTTSRW